VFEKITDAIATALLLTYRREQEQQGQRVEEQPPAREVLRPLPARA
jgi:hypothetical protein